MEYYKINCESAGTWSATLINGVSVITKKLLILCPVGIRNLRRVEKENNYFPLDNIMKLMGKDYHKYQYTLYTTGGILELNTINAPLHRIPIVDHSWILGEDKFPIGGSIIITTRIKDIIEIDLKHLNLETKSSSSNSSKNSKSSIMTKDGTPNIIKKKGKMTQMSFIEYACT